MAARCSTAATQKELKESNSLGVASRWGGAFVVIAVNSMKHLSVSGSQIVQVAPADAILYKGKSLCIFEGPEYVMTLPFCKIISASSSFI